jgi:hypothetical protein
MKQAPLLIPLLMIFAVIGMGSLTITNSAQGSQPPSSEPPISDEKGCIDLSQVKEQVIKDMFDDRGCWVHPYQQFVDAAKSHPGGFGGFYFEGTVVNVYMEDPSQLEAARDAFSQAYDGDREITEIRAVRGRYSADKLWDWYQAIEDGDSEAGVQIVGSGIRFGDNKINLTVQSAEQIEDLHALMDALSVPGDAVDISCCGGVRWGTTVEQ